MKLAIGAMSEITQMPKKLPLAKCRELTLPIFHIRHASTSATSPLNSSKKGFTFKIGFEPQYNEIEIVKNVNSGFIGTDLHTRLQD